MAPTKHQTKSQKKTCASSSECRNKYGKTSLTRKGCNILRDATWMKLTHQHRTKDEEHMLLLNKMEKGESINLSDIKRIRPLSSNDFSTIRSPWLNASILVATNRERHNLLQPQCQRYAAAHGVHVYRWPVKHKKWQQKPTDPSHLDRALQDSCFFEYFVETADGFINGNINKLALLVNGTPFQYHSLVPTSQEQADQIAAQVSRLPPGSIVTLSEPPMAVIIEVMVPKKKIPKWKHLTLIEGRVVLPIQPARSATEWHKTIVNGGDGYLPSKVLIKASFPLEPAFVITVHKAQGRTMKKVILALSERNTTLCNMTYAHIYVALSRVRKAEDIRLLLHEDITGAYDWSNLQYLTALRPDKAIQAFFAGFAERPDHWDPEAALAMYDEL